MQERDLDLFILEELYSGNGFDDWFVEKSGSRVSGAKKPNFGFCKIQREVGETDVLAVFSENFESVAVLIDDKIAADFTERRANRYHECVLNEPAPREGEAIYLRGICLRGLGRKSVPLNPGVPHGHDEFEPAAPPHDRGYDAAQLITVDAAILCVRGCEL
ncbi:MULTISPECIES: hypothetical protein [unclassified Bradyrhizobium]|nr:MULTISPECIES: hypothetical protein [unclassified Bradyrhizobium]MCP1838330.1 hypothetical protein [Bradyrhizobium sp. USDA 4538]MCP1898894.1 hypothetical protein [Bradyrhizobium sp. USDA 4537]MCP1909391.1 hypothetical protein [Bradyrhizobium elkanii]